VYVSSKKIMCELFEPVWKKRTDERHQLSCLLPCDVSASRPPFATHIPIHNTISDVCVYSLHYCTTRIGPERPGKLYENDKRTPGNLPQTDPTRRDRPKWSKNPTTQPHAIAIGSSRPRILISSTCTCTSPSQSPARSQLKVKGKKEPQPVPDKQV
jgi:hypothetical protein